MLVDMNVFIDTFNKCENIKYMWVVGRRHCEGQGRPGGEGQEGRWH